MKSFAAIQFYVNSCHKSRFSIIHLNICRIQTEIDYTHSMFHKETYYKNIKYIVINGHLEYRYNHRSI